MSTKSITWQKKLPLWLTLSRIILTPFIIACLTLDRSLYGYLGASLFILASLTDWWDGHFARKYQVVSNFGKLMDPIADKILVNSTLIMMIPSGRVQAWLVVVLTARDVLIGGLRSVAAADQIVIDAKSSGKWKTALQMVGIPALLVRESVMSVPVERIGTLLLWLSLLLSLFSAYQYVQDYLRRLRGT